MYINRFFSLLVAVALAVVAILTAHSGSPFPRTCLHPQGRQKPRRNARNLCAKLRLLAECGEKVEKEPDGPQKAEPRPLRRGSGY